MKTVLILVEGQTEETFVRDLLQPHLWKHQVHLEPKLATTKRVRGGTNYKGGIVSYDKVKFDIRQLLKDSHIAATTTMIDFYGLQGKGFPGWDTMTGNCYQKVKHLEDAFKQDINHPKFLPYFSLHEYEALLFSEPETIASEMLEANPKIVQRLEDIKDQYDSPEEINLDEPPSFRITEIIPQYKKGLDGVLIALEIGLQVIRQHCNHFNEWLTTLEKL